MWEGRWLFYVWLVKRKKKMIIESIQFDQMRSIVDHYSLGSLVNMHKMKPSTQYKSFSCILLEYDEFLCCFTRQKLIAERLLIEERWIGL